MLRHSKMRALMHIARLLLCASTIACAFSCERSKPTRIAQTSRSQQSKSPATAPTTRAQRPPVHIAIDQQSLEFPAAVIELKRRDDVVQVRLMSDDPKDAFNKDYTGNSFYLEMDIAPVSSVSAPADINEVKDLAGQEWRYSSGTTERSEVPTGLFLEGTHVQLQPQDLSATFRASPDDPSAVIVDLSGTFLRFDMRAENPVAQPVKVTATLHAVAR